MSQQLILFNPYPINYGYINYGEKEEPRSSETDDVKDHVIIPNRVYVGGVAPETTNLDIIRLFSNYGNIIGSNLIKDREGLSKGYGFVTFETEEEASRLLNHTERIRLGGRLIKIAPARSNQPANEGGKITKYRDNDYNVLKPACENGILFVRYRGTSYFGPPFGLAQQPQPTSGWIE